jgi:hypothetical protein
VRLLLLAAALALLSDCSPEVRLFDGGGWEVWCAGDTGAAPRYLAASVRGGSARLCSELKVRRRMDGLGTPQVFSIKGQGALRPALPPPGAFGATFYASGYWDCALGLRQTLAIEALDVSLDPRAPSVLRFEGRASNPPTLVAPDFALRLEPPSHTALHAAVSYTLVASDDVCVSSAKRANHEAFRVARAASNYLSRSVHDSDAVHYVAAGHAVCRALANREDFALREHDRLSGAPLRLVHREGRPRPTPTMALRFVDPPPAEITPQGYVTATEDPNADNVDLWGHWEGARPRYRPGERIGRFAFELEALAPDAGGC